MHPVRSGFGKLLPGSLPLLFTSVFFYTLYPSFSLRFSEKIA
uniref:Uncharacterized protein n=1 Tax=Arundo donax TaxID=35708 RepID=A0A0A9FSF2_ARUDO